MPRRATCSPRWAKARGFSIFTDAIGNLFVRREGSDATALPVMSGSHMDSQPTGGRFDGMYGVLAAFEALEALEDAGLKTKRPVMAVAWTNEEGSRFQPGAMGSAVFAGRNKLDDMLAVKDWKGVVLKDALAETLKAAPAPMREGKPGFPLDGYVEAHIEQGPRLENEHKTIGVVTGIQGSRRYIVEVDGRGSACRHDAARRPQGRLRRRDAHGRRDVRGHDRRPGHAALHHRAGRGLIPARPTPCRARRASPSTCAIPRTTCWTRTRRRCWPSWRPAPRPAPRAIERVTAVAPTDFDRRVIDLVRAKAQALGLSNMDMPSGAGHDAMHIARLCPAGMIFVPCERGISHNEIENATPADLAAGARVLVEVLVELANR